ncbi:MAG TPA: NADPH-dependent F420 reductase [Dehalococcoidia bacterium]|nr:NADPH-dependent F420 reductase [Dehalococcoidia bacterium]
MTIGFVGGTGEEGKGLAFRLALAGERCVIGSRSRERAEAAAAELRERAEGLPVFAGLNADACREAEIVIVTVPYEGMRDTLSALADDIGAKIVVSAVVPMRFEGKTVRYTPPAEGSAAQEAQALLPKARVVGAFQNLSARKLLEGDVPLDADVIVCGDDAEAKAAVAALAERIRGVRAIDGGGLASAPFVEAITPLLVNINRRYRTQASIRIVGV